MEGLRVERDDAEEGRRRLVVEVNLVVGNANLDDDKH
jgi:hypothetical protein